MHIYVRARRLNFLRNKSTTSKTWTQTLDTDPEKPGLRKTWTLKNAGNSWMQKKKKIRIPHDIIY